MLHTAQLQPVAGLDTILNRLKIREKRTLGLSKTAETNGNKKFELMLTRRAKAYSSSGSVV